MLLPPLLFLLLSLFMVFFFLLAYWLRIKALSVSLFFGKWKVLIVLGMLVLLASSIVDRFLCFFLSLICYIKLPVLLLLSSVPIPIPLLFSLSFLTLFWFCSFSILLFPFCYSSLSSLHGYHLLLLLSRHLLVWKAFYSALHVLLLLPFTELSFTAFALL